MDIRCSPRDSTNQQEDAFLIEGPWAEIAYVLKWIAANCSTVWESNFIPNGNYGPGNVSYNVKFKDERDAIFFKMMWHGHSFSEVA
jgi:hypothetical protein